ncbi:two-component system response regulator [Thauera sp.]|uniref:two-component system response regulator n=1 Tax=Thauera sp. TaxID=1905334 RepID=UPI002A36A98B|nr:two-component system response regulator [Thauera sp.]MDX9885446.1 two-component system response regulator [Thauera sp.]
MRSDEGAPIRLLIVIPEQEGEGVVERQLVQATLRGVEVVGRAHTESQALARYFQCAPDIVVLDCQIMPEEPARLVGLLKRMAPGSCIIALVPAADSMAGSAARALGADAIGVLADLPALLHGLTAADAV